MVGLYSLWLRAQGRLSLRVAAWSMSTLHYWFHIPGSFNWYVPALLAFYLLAPGYQQLFTRCRHREWLTAASFPVSYGLYRLALILGTGHVADFLYRLPAFAMGFLAGAYLLEERPFTRRHAAVWGGLALAGIITGVLRLRGVLYLPTCYFIAAVLMPLCLLLAKGLDLLPWPPLHRTLGLIGRCSLEIYLLNVIVTRELGGAGHYLAVGAANSLLGVALHRGIEALRFAVRHKS